MRPPDCNGLRLWLEIRPPKDNDPLGVAVFGFLRLAEMSIDSKETWINANFCSLALIIAEPV